MITAKPNFFIVGAPRCGTTALSEYLREHPNIFLTRPKEPNFFATDFYRPITTLKEYQALFKNVSNNHLAVGEGSVVYLFSEGAIERLNEYSPGAKIIVMVRNPIEMVTSLHSRLLVTLYEDEKDFGKAWELQEKRRNGLAIPEHCRSPRFLDYKNIASLGAQVEHLFSVIDRNLVEILVFDDFAASPKSVYENALKYLGVPLDGRTRFPKINTNKVSHSNAIARIAQRPPALLVRSYRKIKGILNFGQLGLLRRINDINSTEVKRENVSLEMKYHLQEVFHDDVLLLSDLIERDLTHWVKDGK